MASDEWRAKPVRPYSVDDARATLLLYQKNEKQWERTLQGEAGGGKGGGGGGVMAVTLSTAVTTPSSTT